MKNGLSFYKQKGEIRWRICQSGRIIAASTEGYKRMRDAKRNLISIARKINAVAITRALQNFK